MSVKMPTLLVPWTISDLCARCCLIATQVRSERYDEMILKVSAARKCLLCRYLYEELVVSDMRRTRRKTYLEVTRHHSHLGVIDFNNTFHDFEIFAEHTMPNLVTPYRRIQSHVDAEPCFGLIQDWLDNCRNNHPSCRQDSPPRIPNLLIDVNDLRLVKGASCGSRAKYATLSHCWGTKLHMAMLTTRTADSFQTGFDHHFLPRNFQDAIYITRKLGVPYLWIDALCVIQDDAGHWKSEIANMGNYYRHAFVTLSALSAHNPSVGILNQRNVHSSISLSYGLSLRRARPTWSEVFRNSPLSRRAWVLQERLLSARIVHFEKDELFWECSETAAREGSSDESSGLWQGDEWTDESFKRCLAFTNPITDATGNTAWQPSHADFGKLCMTQWYRIVVQYSGLALTYDNDILPAIAGIAEKFHEVTRFTYRSGIWMEHAHTGLLWYVNSSRSSSRPDNPTWSWTHVHGPVKMLFDSYSEAASEQHAAKVVQSSDDTHWGPTFSSVQGMELELDAHCLNVWCQSSSKGDAPYSDPFLRMVVSIFDENGLCVGTGYLDQIPENPSSQYTAVVISQRSDSRFGGKLVTFFLLVQRDEQDDFYRRVGIGQTADEIYGHVTDTLHLERSMRSSVLIR